MILASTICLKIRRSPLTDSLYFSISSESLSPERMSLTNSPTFILRSLNMHTCLDCAASPFPNAEPRILGFRHAGTTKRHPSPPWESVARDSI